MNDPVFILLVNSTLPIRISLHIFIFLKVAKRKTVLVIMLLYSRNYKISRKSLGRKEIET